MDPAVSTAEKAYWAQRDCRWSKKCEISPYTFLRQRGSIIKISIISRQAAVC